MFVASVAKYNSGFEVPQKILFQQLLNESAVAVEFLENYDEETSVHSKDVYRDYLVKVDSLIASMIKMYELEIGA